VNLLRILISYLGLSRPDRKEREVEKILRHRFGDPSLLRRALTHRSMLTETGEGPEEANERLELLGDAVLDLIVVEGLWRHFPHLQEGDISKLKAMLVSGQALHSVARSLRLGQYIRMSESEERNGGRSRSSILEDAFEAIVAALYLDGGMRTAREFVLRTILSRADALASNGVDINYKSQLLEYAQARGMATPHYQVIAERGPDHSKQFEVEVFVGGEVKGSGRGSSKKAAQQSAARAALFQLQQYQSHIIENPTEV